MLFLFRMELKGGKRILVRKLFINQVQKSTVSKKMQSEKDQILVNLPQKTPFQPGVNPMTAIKHWHQARPMPLPSTFLWNKQFASHLLKGSATRQRKEEKTSASRGLQRNKKWLNDERMWEPYNYTLIIHHSVLNWLVYVAINFRVL